MRTSKSIMTERAGHDRIPLTSAQLQMWLMDQMTSVTPAYGLAVAYRLKGQLDVAALEASFNEVIKRHEILRTTFALNEGEPIQHIHCQYKIKILVVRVDQWPAEESEETIRLLARNEATTPFDLSKLPLVRLMVFKLSELENVLLINLHHILADGHSLGLMLGELDTFYSGLTGSRRAPERLPELTVQYADFALWQRRHLAAETFQGQIAFWKRQFPGQIPVLDIPTDLPRPAAQSFRGSNAFFYIPNPLANALAALGAREGCTVFTTLLAALQVLLHRYSGARDMVVGTPVALRTPKEVEPLIGNFLNVIPLRLDLSGNPTFLQVLRRTRSATLHAYARADLPFEKLVEDLSPERDASRNPVFQIMFELSPALKLEMGDLEVSAFYFDLGFAQFDLSLHVSEELGGYACRFEYCTDLFRADTMDRMSLNFMELLAAAVTNPDQRVSKLSILSRQEKRQVLLDWNETSRLYPPDQCVHHLFEAIAQKEPNNVAVEYAGMSLTYADLNLEANRFADHLITQGVKPGQLVGVCVGRSAQLVIVLLGIMKAGAAYVPLDPSFPSERLAYMVQHADISVLVTEKNLLNATVQSARKVICIDNDRSTIRQRNSGNPDLTVKSSNLAYVIFTSGSSGRPKGVMIEHGAVVNFLRSMQEQPGFVENDVMVAVTTISFDIAGLEIFLPLVSGGKVVIADQDEAKDGCLLLQLLKRSGATTLQATPSTWKLLIDANWEGTPKLKMLCGGEALSRELANQLLERGGELWNMYGPTETTIWSSVQKIEPGEGPILIGRPIANTKFYIVNSDLEPVPIGASGELLIGGNGLSRGYLNDAELTKERFIQNPFTDSGNRLYRTGDLAKFHPDGCVEFLGRFDFQVKIRGYRIELEEIERVLVQHESIKHVAVLASEAADGDKQLVAYYIPSAGKEAKPGDLRRFLEKKLPHYMCPAFFVKMRTFPSTPNGKIDRKAFPNPVASEPDASSRYAAPETDLEERLVAIWQETVKRTRIGIDDNFFEIGGHSLLAARLFARIENVLGVKVPLAVLFQASSIRKLADFIEESGWKSNWTSLVPIQIHGDRPPLFLVHGAEGNVLFYRSLARRIHNQPIYGLQSRGLDGRGQLESDIKSMATKYIEEMRTIQPIGPYYIGGYCLGGTIALEIAQQLKRAGESVALLIMIETYNLRIARPGSLALKTTHSAQNIYFHIRNLFLSLSDGSFKFFAQKFNMELSRLKLNFSLLRARIFSRFQRGGKQEYQHLQIRVINDEAQASYWPAPYDGKILLFKPKAGYRHLNDPFFGWGIIATGGVEVFEMPNYPRGSLNEPFVDVLARKLEAEIETTLDRSMKVNIPPNIHPIQFTAEPI